jgi:Immunoglobulin domain
MKTKIKSSQMFKALLVAGLLAAPGLAFNATAQQTEAIKWSPLDVFTDANGNAYAYWNDPNNWDLGVVPTYFDTNNGDVYQVHIDGTPGSIVACVITNDTQVGQIMMGDGGSGTLIITNGAQVQCAIDGTNNDGQWTGIGFPTGPSTLYIGPGCSFTIGSHLWVGQGTNNLASGATPGSAPGTVIVDGGTLNIPSGQLGVGWNGVGGTNFITFTNGGKMFLDTWASSTLGAPGNPKSKGIMDIEPGSIVVVTNNQLSYMSTLTADGQLIASGGQGTISAVYNPALNITELTGLAPTGPDTPVFSLQPSNSVVSVGGTATLTAAASPATGYQWLFNSVPLTDGNGISGSTTATLTIANFNAAEAGNYSVTVTNTAAVSQNDRNYASSQVVSVSAESFNLYPVITINGVNGSTYVVQYANSLTPPVTWNTLTTVTAGAGPLQVVDTATPLNISRFYRVVQQ